RSREQMDGAPRVQLLVDGLAAHRRAARGRGHHEQQEQQRGDETHRPIIAAGMPRTLPGMSRSLIERRLREVHDRLRRARDELAVLDEQLAVFAEAADDARLRALVSETPLANREHHEAQRHADAMARSRTALVATIAELEQTQDKLLDRLVVESR